jgi:hypothetical protein
VRFKTGVVVTVINVPPNIAGPVDGVTDITVTTGSYSYRIPPDVNSTPFGETSSDTIFADSGGDLHIIVSLLLNDAGTTISPNLQVSWSELIKFLPMTVTNVKPAVVP